MSLLPNPSNIPLIPQTSQDPKQDANNAFSDISVQLEDVRTSVPDTEAIQDIIAAFLMSGTGISVTYDDVANTFTVVNTAPLTTEAVQDIVGAMVTSGANITSTYNDTAGTLTIAAAGSSTITTEDVQDIVGALLLAGTNVSLNYNDAANTLTITASTSSITASQISDSTTVGRALLTAATASAQRIALGLDMPASGYELVPDWPGIAAATVTPAAANVVYVAHFILRNRITVAQTNVREVAGTSLTFISWGVYDSTGNTRLIDTGPVNAATNSTKNTPLGSPVTLEPGLYWLAWTTDNATNSVVGLNPTTIFNTIGFGTGSPHIGSAANASVAGQLPTTLGTITGAAVNMPLVRLQS